MPSLVEIFSLRIVKEFLKYSPSKIISILIGLFSFKFYTGVFTASDYGILNLILNTFSLITVLLSGWIGYVLIRYYERNKVKNELPDFLSTLFSSLLVLNLVLVFVLFIISLLFFKNDIIYLIAFVSLPISIINSLLPVFYQLNQDIFRYNFYNVFSVLGTFILFLLLYFLLNKTLLAFFLSTVIVNFFLLGLSLKDFKRFNLKFHVQRKELIEYIKYGVPQIGTAVGIVLLSITSRYFIQYFRGNEEVGIFSAAFKFGEMSILLPLSLFTGIFAPYIFREFELKGKETATVLIKNYTILYILIFGPLFILLFTFPKLPLFLLGANFDDSLQLIPYVCFGNFMFGYTQFLALHCQLDFKPVTMTISVFCSVIINITLNYFLIPKYGNIGASYAIIGAYLSYIFFVIWLSKIELSKIPLVSFFMLFITTGLFYIVKKFLLIHDVSFMLSFILGFTIWVVLLILLLAFKQINLNSKFEIQ